MNNSRVVPHLMYADIYLNDATYYLDIYCKDPDELITSFGFYVLDSESINSGVYHRINTIAFQQDKSVQEYYAILSKHETEVFKFIYNDFFEIFKKKKI